MNTTTNPHALLGAGPGDFGPPAGLAAEGDGFGPADFLRVLKQRKLTILISGILLYALVIGLTFATFYVLPAWSSEMVFELELPKAIDFIQTTEQLQPQIVDQLVRTEANKLRQLDLMQEVVSQEEFKRTAYFRWYEQNALNASVGLQEDLAATPIPDSTLIRVRLSCMVRDEARLILQLLQRQYEKLYQSEARGEMTEQSEALRNTDAELKRRLESVQREMRSFRDRTDIPALETQRAAARNFIGELKQSIALLETEAITYQEQLNAMAGFAPDALPITAEAQLIIESDPELRFFRTQVEALDVQLEVLAKRLGPKHREFERTQETRDSYFAKETAKREELTNQVRQQQRERLLQGLAETRGQVERLSEKLAVEEATESDISRNLLQFQELQAEQERSQRLLDDVSNSMLKMEQARTARTTAHLRLVQQPQLAPEPSRPDFKVWLIGGFFLAFAGGVGIAFLRELTDKAVRTPLDVQRHGRLAVLGTIPLLDDDQSDLEEIEHAVRSNPQSLLAESYRRVRTALQFSGPAEQQHALLVTSPSAGDGKTSVAINLAVTVALGNQRVLLIDCNFRRPTMRTAFKISRVEGLSNILIGRGALDELVNPTDVGNLTVLTSGPMPPSPAELLASDAMRNLLAEARRKYDRVILDGPPVLLMSDAGVLATMVDGVILVARAEDNTKGALRRAREQLEALNVRVVGAVLNGVRTRPGGYLRQQYRDFYDYTSDDALPPELPGPQDGPRPT